MPNAECQMLECQMLKCRMLECQMLKCRMWHLQLRKQVHMEDDELQEIFNEADTDGSGNIDYHEFVEIMGTE